MVRVAWFGLRAGSGDRVAAVRAALRELGNVGRVVRTSSLVCSPSPPPEARGVPAADATLHAVAGVETSASVVELLAAATAVAASVRAAAVALPSSTTATDVDLVALDDASYAGGGLALDAPAPRGGERHQALLQALAEVAGDLRLPPTSRTVSELAGERVVPALPRAFGARAACPLSGSPAQVWTWGARSYVMGILNMSPDSDTPHVKDEPSAAALEAASRHALAMVAAGADVIDIGGYATGVTGAAEAREMARVVPAVRALRASGLSVPISVDTFSAAVAEEAVAAGADIVNDISGGTVDERMAPLATRLGVPFILMHCMEESTRKYSARMSKAAWVRKGLGSGQGDFSRWPGGVAEAVVAELGAQTQLALAAGLPRFDVVMDPGLGISKSPADNLAVLQHLDVVRAGLGDLPVLMGLSRKAWLGGVLQHSATGLWPVSDEDIVHAPTAADRVWATAAATACCVPAVDIHRVHDVKEMVDVLRVADAVRRKY